MPFQLESLHTAFVKATSLPNIRRMTTSKIVADETARRRQADAISPQRKLPRKHEYAPKFHSPGRLRRSSKRRTSAGRTRKKQRYTPRGSGPEPQSPESARKLLSAVLSRCVRVSAACRRQASADSRARSKRRRGRSSGIIAAATAAAALDSGEPHTRHHTGAVLGFGGTSTQLFSGGQWRNFKFCPSPCRKHHYGPVFILGIHRGNIPPPHKILYPPPKKKPIKFFCIRA